MAGHLISQRFVFKIHSARLCRSKWNLKLTVEQARENKELITLSESQMMRFIDELNGISNPESQIAAIKSQIRELKREKNISRTRPLIRKLYRELDEYQFMPDYVCVVIDSVKHYHRMYKSGFQINGVAYRRLLGTTGGVKSNTIVFVSERLLPELKRRMDNGRNLHKEFSPAKLEAYLSLVCSSSVPVSSPQGIVVVPDCVTHFQSDVIELDDTGLDQPRMRHLKDKEIALDNSDGYGMGMPSLMKRWGEEMGKDYILPGCVIRNAFLKGTVFCVDFQKFARDNNLESVTDVWGNTYDISQVELVLTESMVKLWDSYSSLEDYLANCEKNNYTFAVTKSSELNLESERTMNYQFLQSYQFTDDQIEELIAPTVDELNDILSGDYRKMILYAKGTKLNERSVRHLDATFTTALMIDRRMMFDPYVRDQIHAMIRKRIDRAKVGVLNVPANYSLVSGDPYSLCQSMFGLTVTGLLRAGQVYSKYWADRGVDRIVSFRAPMTSHNNIRLLQVARSQEMDEFYQYMTTPTIFNSWDTCADAMNGFDMDGDCVINTSFPLLVENTRELPAIVCVQHKAPKCVPTEEDLMKSNLNSFGNAVGEITNRITSMFEVQARFEPGSRESAILDYRIKCGQLYQQNAIDKTKGIESKPMPDRWYSWIANKAEDDLTSRERKSRWMNHRIAADKKPYFMKYIYPSEKAKYDEYVRNNDNKCLMRFRSTLDELLQKKSPTREEQEFIDCYHRRLPLGTAPCTINQICWKIEEKFDGCLAAPDSPFDYSILKCGTGYSPQMFNKIKKIYNRYQKELADYNQFAKRERIHPSDRQIERYVMKEQFRRQCEEECPSAETLCDIVLDLCYTKKTTKQFAWDMCGDMFVMNLLRRNGYQITFPTADPTGDVAFHGETYRMETVQLDSEDEEALRWIWF